MFTLMILSCFSGNISLIAQESVEPVSQSTEIRTELNSLCSYVSIQPERKLSSFGFVCVVFNFSSWPSLCCTYRGPWDPLGGLFLCLCSAWLLPVADWHIIWFMLIDAKQSDSSLWLIKSKAALTRSQKHFSVSMWSCTTKSSMLTVKQYFNNKDKDVGKFFI